MCQAHAQCRTVEIGDIALVADSLRLALAGATRTAHGLQFELYQRCCGRIGQPRHPIGHPDMDEIARDRRGRAFLDRGAQPALGFQATKRPHPIRNQSRVRFRRPNSIYPAPCVPERKIRQERAFCIGRPSARRRVDHGRIDCRTSVGERGDRRDHGLALAIGKSVRH